MAKPRDALNVVGTVLVMLAVIGVLFGMAWDIGGDGGGSGPGSWADVPVSDGYVEVEAAPSNVSDATVSATRGNAIAFEGEGHVQTDAVGDGVPQTAFTSCAVVHAHDSWDAEATYSVLSVSQGQLTLELDHGRWVGYATNGSHSVRTSVPAPNPTEQTPVCVGWEPAGDEVTVLANGNTNNSSDMNTAAETRNVSVRWVGGIDELRAWSAPPAVPVLNDYASDPIAPRAEMARTGRAYFDEGSGNDTELYFADAQANISGGTWVDGVEGPGLTEGTDYNIRYTPLEVAIPNESYVADAPVVFVSWEGGGGAMFADALRTMERIVGVVIVLGALVALVMAAKALQGSVGGGGGF